MEVIDRGAVMELENGIYRSPSNFDSYVYYTAERKEGRGEVLDHYCTRVESERD